VEQTGILEKTTEYCKYLMFYIFIRVKYGRLIFMQSARLEKKCIQKKKPSFKKK
jgi:hypothetical protein